MQLPAVSLDDEQDRPLRWALEALRAALGRYDNEYRGSSGSETTQERLGRAYAAVAEAVWWVAALDEQLAGRYGDPYRDARNEDPNGRVVIGLRWARHRHSHQLPLTIRFEEGAFLPLSLPLRLSRTFLWRPTSELPTGRPSHEELAAYTAHVAERTAGEPVELALRWFEAVQGQPGSPLHSPT